MSDDGGANWQEAPARLADSIRALIANDHQLWGVGNEMVLSSADNGGAWAPRLDGEKLEAMAAFGETGGRRRDE
jgi:photosystem II stability/assembly factor-like uncharacterized protein